MPELHFTVDTQVVMIGAGMSNLAALPSHTHLLRLFDDAAFLALDKDGQVRAEYERKMSEQSAGRQWLTVLAKNDRIRMHDLIKLPTKVRVELEKAHFDPDDRRFVRLAMATESKCLVAEESDYSAAVRKVLRKHAGVHVHSAESACALIADHQAENQQP